MDNATGGDYCSWVMVDDVGSEVCLASISGVEQSRAEQRSVYQLFSATNKSASDADAQLMQVEQHDMILLDST